MSVTSQVKNPTEVLWALKGRLPVIRGGGRPRVSEEEALLAEEAIRKSGVVLFRGFDVSVDDFRALTRRLGSTYALEKWAPDAAKPNGPFIGLHIEQAFLPSIPAAIWFYNAKPAEHGGATIICDGAEIFDALSAPMRRLLGSTDVLYWRRFSGSPPERVHVQYFTDPPGLERHFREGETIQHDGHYETTSLCRPLIRSRFARGPVFGNHILNTVTHPGQDGPPAIDGFHQARLPNREPLPQELIDELKVVTGRLCMKIKLEARDMLWVDNTRCLHGRDAFEGTRQILVVKAYHADQWLPGFDPADYPSPTAGPIPGQGRAPRS